MPRNGAAAGGGALAVPGGGASGCASIEPAPGRCDGGRFIGAGSGSLGGKSRLDGKLRCCGRCSGTSAGGLGGAKIDPNCARTGADATNVNRTAHAIVGRSRNIKRVYNSSPAPAITNQVIDG